jgi:hypothetical protein
MRDLMREGGEFLGGLHPGKQRNLPAVRQALGRRNLVGVGKSNALGFHELYHPFAVIANIALHFGQGWKVFALGLVDVLSRDLRPSLCALDGFRL